MENLDFWEITKEEIIKKINKLSKSYDVKELYLSNIIKRKEIHFKLELKRKR